MSRDISAESSYHPFLPPELERLIFELYAWGDDDNNGQPTSLRARRQRSRKLLLVAKRLHLWIEPILHHTLTLVVTKDLIRYRIRPSLCAHIRVLFCQGKGPEYPNEDLKFLLTHATNIHSIFPVNVRQCMSQIAALPKLKHLFWIHTDHRNTRQDLTSILSSLQNPHALTHLTLVIHQTDTWTTPNGLDLSQFLNLRYITFLTVTGNLIDLLPLIKSIADEATQVDAVAIFDNGSSTAGLDTVDHNKLVHIVRDGSTFSELCREFSRLGEGWPSLWDDVDRIVEARKLKSSGGQCNR